MTNDHWKVLGIAPTTSTLAIKKAYTVLLRSCNPEDKPEEFKALRKAYQAALKASKKISAKDIAPVNTQVDDGPPQTNASPEPKPQGDIKEINLLKKAIDTIYQDTARRLSLASWEALFTQEIFWDADLNQEVKLACIEYFVSKPCLPADVLYLAEKSLNFYSEYESLIKGEHRELAEKFMVIINTAHLRFPLDVLSKSRCAFRELETHLELRRQFEDILIFENAEIEALEALISQRAKTFEFDVLLEQSLAKQYINQQQFEKATALLESLNDQYQNVETFNMLAQLKLDSGDVLSAHHLFRSALSIEPDNLTASKGSALCFFKEKKYDIASDILQQLEGQLFCDIELKTTLTQARVNRLKELEANASDDNMVERAELLIDLGRHKDAYWVFGELPEEQPKETGLKRFFSKPPKKEPEQVRLLRARASANFGHEAFAAKVYCEIIQERLSNKENVLDVLKDMLKYCAYELTAEQVMFNVIDNMEDLTKAAQANSESDPDYWLAVGFAHFRITRKISLTDEQRDHHDRQTILALDHLISLRPHDANYHWEAAHILYYLKQYEKSIVSYKIAEKSKMYYSGIPLYIGKAYCALQQYSKALEACTRAMSLASNDKTKSKIYECIATIHYEKKEYKKAINALQTYQTMSGTNHIEDNIFMSKICYLLEKETHKGESFSENLLDWHKSGINGAKNQENYERLYEKSPDFIAAVERAVEITQVSFPDKSAFYEELLSELKKAN